jgi:hypothetical protein
MEEPRDSSKRSSASVPMVVSGGDSSTRSSNKMLGDSRELHQSASDSTPGPAVGVGWREGMTMGGSSDPPARDDGLFVLVGWFRFARTPQVPEDDPVELHKVRAGPAA